MNSGKFDGSFQAGLEELSMSEMGRLADMRPWFDRESGLYLIPDDNTALGNSTCFKFDRGLRTTAPPWTDIADLERGLDLARALLLPANGEGADDRHG